MHFGVRAILAAALLAGLAAGAKKKVPQLSPLDQYLEQAARRAAEPVTGASAGSLWSPAAHLADFTRDLRASRVDDVITIVVAERASAVVSGTTKSARSSSTKNSIGALAGLTRATGPLANLATLSGDTQLSGDGTTSRETVLTTTLSARVTQVLPNGVLAVEGTKTVQVNSEQQIVVVRGLVRPADVSPANTVPSDRIASLEVRINGKGVVGDAVRRPFWLYRLILGLLPF
jgi:flagellar L-ring protein precursor FlgH